MTKSTRQWERNVVGLHKTAQAKAAATRQRAEEAIQILLKEKRPINFKTVAETAHVSTAWLYGQTDIRQQILGLRTQQEPKPKIVIPPHERASDASKDGVIAILRKRVQEQAEEIRKLKQQENEEARQLRRQVEVAYGHLSLYQQKYGPLDGDA